MHHDPTSVSDWISNPSSGAGMAPFPYYDGISVRPVLLRPQSRGFILLNASDPLWGAPQIYPRFFTKSPDLKVFVAGKSEWQFKDSFIDWNLERERSRSIPTYRLQRNGGGLYVLVAMQIYYSQWHHSQVGQQHFMHFAVPRFFCLQYILILKLFIDFWILNCIFVSLKKP